MVDHFEQRKARARERLRSIDGRWWCFAVVGLRMASPEYCVANLLRLRPVQEPPGEIELAAALSSPAMFSAIGRYSQMFSHELAVNCTFGTENGPFNLAWWFVSALRVKSGCNIIVPAVADASWGTISAAPEHSVKVQLLEDYPKAFKFGKSDAVTLDDLNWAAEHLTEVATLLENSSFRLAVEAVTTHHHHANLRMATAALWAGVESLFQINQELRFRLAALVAALLESPGESRLELYREVKQLYDFRSRAVHGVSVSDDDLCKHIQRTRAILARVLCEMIAQKHVLTQDELEGRLFGCA